MPISVTMPDGSSRMFPSRRIEMKSREMDREGVPPTYVDEPVSNPNWDFLRLGMSGWHACPKQVV